MPNKKYGEWEIAESLSEGGQARVYIADNPNISKRGTLKVLKNLSDGARRERFKREMDAVRRIDHPNVVRVIDDDVEAEKPYIVFEYVPGNNLGQKELENVFLETRIEWFMQICDGLKAAHDADVVHRDIKPENIIIGDDERLRICDFGLVFVDDEDRLTGTMEQVGSRYYIPPECECGQAELIGRSTDVYSLGKVLYYLLSGGEMFSREQHRHDRWDLSKLLDDPYMERFSAILDKMIVADTTQRIQDVNDVKSLVAKEYSMYMERLPVPGSFETYRCLFCGDGTYKIIISSKDHTSQNYGYTEGKTHNQYLVFLECPRCGNSQRFKLRYAGQEWFGVGNS